MSRPPSHPSPGRLIYVGTDDGLFRLRRDGGSSYAVELLGLRGAGMVAHPLVVDCADPTRLYAGTYQAGVWRSLDAGQTWHEINQGIIYKEVWSLVQHPVTGVLYAGTGPSSVFKSTDRGETWQDCAHLRSLRGAPRAVAADPGDPDTFLVGLTDGGVWITEDGGESFAEIARLPTWVRSLRVVSA